MRALGRLEEALRDFDRAVSLKPEDSAAYYNRAHCLGQMKRNEEALAACERSLALEPNFLWALNLRSGLLRAKGDFE